MAVTSAIVGVLALAGGTVSQVQASNARKDAQGAADFQKKQAEAAQEKLKAGAQQGLEAENLKKQREKEAQALAAKTGFASTVAGSTVGGSVSAGQGQKTLIGS